MITQDFLDTVEPLRCPGMGTEHVAGLIYSMVRMTRPSSLLEIGLGYTTPFLLQALSDNIDEYRKDQQRLAGDKTDDPRLQVLRPQYYRNNYTPGLLAIDDRSDEDEMASAVPEVLEKLGLSGLINRKDASFRGLTTTPGFQERYSDFDFVWFDCGGPQEYVDFLNEYWRWIDPDGGVLLLHYTYWHLPTVKHRRDGIPISEAKLTPSPMLAEIKRQHGLLGLDANYEVLSLVEPHKNRQGGVTIIRRILEDKINGDSSFSENLNAVGFNEVKGDFTL